MSMIDPIQSLSFSIQSNPGVYALLLGSGVSRSAGIPTGWEIVIDLVGKLAAANGHSTDTDLEQWYLDKYGEAPEYSKILDSLAKTQSERQQLLRPYFEPNEQEREEGLKQPTTAHRAIARLVAGGHVKVIVTTNFDRLIERALEDEGVVPTVLSTKDQVQGALPLIHTNCCVFKIHGDYMDPRILNSPTELGTYPEEYDELLDRIFDDFGLIVCGWSADWDVALRKAVTRTSSRRFTTFWSVRVEANDEAQRLIEHRQAQVVPIRDADTFFETIQQTVQSLDEYSKPHPFSTEATVESLKRYLSGPEHRIQLSDLIDSAVDQVLETTSGEVFRLQVRESPTKESITARIRSYESACTTLIAMASTAGFWAEEDNTRPWERAIERLSTMPSVSDNQFWNRLGTYPGTLLIYTYGMGAVESDRLFAVNRLFRTTVNVDANVLTSGTTTCLTSLVLDRSLLSQRGALEGYENHDLPINNWLYDTLQQPLNRLFSDKLKYSYLFDKFEILVSLAYYHHNRHWTDYVQPGSFMYRKSNTERILDELEKSIQTLGDESSLVASGIFGIDPGDCMNVLVHFKTRLPEIARSLRLYWDYW
ncbi:MAG: hypothetical protein F4X72_04995 [Dehalococcoidia bacterium]|nr:hypothetical protein [Dehalococcoidia bacterium]